MANNKQTVAFLSMLYVGIIALLGLFKVFDNDYNVTKNSFINLIIFITLLYIILLISLIIQIRKDKGIFKKQMTVFEEHDYIIDEYQKNELLQALYRKNTSLRQKMVSINEEQDRWVHDIKIPLATLKMFISNRKHEYDKEDIHVLEEIATKIQDDINKKIMFDKIELELDDIKVDKINISDLIKNIIKTNRSAFIYKHMSVDFQAQDFYVFSDERTIQYAIEQIISNALKYADDNTQLKIYYQDETLWIESEGQPLDEEDAKRIFDKGYTGKNSINKGMASTGFGLYMVKKSLKHLDLDIQVKVDGKKTMFGINFNKSYDN